MLHNDKRYSQARKFNKHTIFANLLTPSAKRLIGTRTTQQAITEALLAHTKSIAEADRVLVAAVAHIGRFIATRVIRSYLTTWEETGLRRDDWCQEEW
jgi:hypothetical protein